MKIVRRDEVTQPAEAFQVLTGSRRSQIAAMVLQPGEVSGEYGNEHPHADQILYVIEGEAEVLVAGSSERLQPGDAILIEAGQEHQIRATGNSALRTFNVYAPPGY